MKNILKIIGGLTALGLLILSCSPSGLAGRFGSEEPAYRYSDDPNEQQLKLTRADKQLVQNQFQAMRENFELLLEHDSLGLAQEQNYLLANPELKGLDFDRLVYGLPQKYDPSKRF